MGLRFKDLIPSRQRRQEVNKKSQTSQNLEARARKLSKLKKLKWMIAVLNCLQLIFGIVLLIMQYSNYQLHDDVSLKHAKNMMLMPLVYLPTAFVVVVGVLLVAVAIYGFYSIRCEKKRALTMFIVFDILLILVNAVGLTTVASFSSERISKIDAAMSQDKNLTDCSVTMQFDHAELSFSLCHAQRDLRCCGIRQGDEDYGSVHCNLPITCCDNTNQKTCCQSDTSVHKKGCFLLLLERLVYSSNRFAIISMVIAFIGLFACVLLTVRFLGKLKADANAITTVKPVNSKPTTSADQQVKKTADKVQVERGVAAINLQQVAEMRKT